MSKLTQTTLGEISNNFDNVRVPLSVTEREKLVKKYRYYGAQGVIDYVDNYLLDGEYILVAEDGENLKSQKNNICNFVTGKFWVNNHAHILNASNSHDTKYLYYKLSLVNFKNYVTGSAQPKLTKDNLNSIILHIHKDSEQRRIAAVLSALDAKIDCNNRINTELESMAKTLYDYWFVQFDFPDANGKPYKSSGGKMVYNATLKREIPEGWNDGSLWDIARYFNGLAMQKYRPNGSDYLPVIKIREMSEGLSNSTEKASPDIHQDAIINDGDVLFSWSATLDVRIWSRGRGALNQHIFKVTSDKYPKTFYYFELLGYLAHFKMMAEKRKTTMGHITQDHLKQSKICIPPTDLLCKAHEMIDRIFKKRLVHEKENQELVRLRDWLLPMLMNGQVTVA